MRVVLAGGSGQVGRILARALHADAHDVVVLSRSPHAGTPWRVIPWDGVSSGDWTSSIDGADVVVNLAGRSVDCRYTPRNRAAIMDSRVLSTRAVGEAIARASRPPRAWLQMSTATIYAHRYDAANDEETGIIGGAEPDAPPEWHFSIEVAKAWERAAHRVATPRTRKVLLRSAMVMSPDRGGVFDALLRLVRFGAGGRIGDGRQYMSWIHERDFIRAVRWLIDNDVDGAINLAAPEPLPCDEFLRELREAWGSTLAIPASGLVLEIGAMLARTEPELVLKSRRVMPGRLMEHNFVFDFTTWHDAARDLCARWKGEVAVVEPQSMALW